MNLRCKKCNRWLGTIEHSVDGLVIKCGNCKANNEFNVVMISEFRPSMCYNLDRRGATPQSQQGQSKTANAEEVRVERKTDEKETNPKLSSSN